MPLRYMTPETKLAIKIVAIAIFTMNLIGCMEIKRNNPFDEKNPVYSDLSLYVQIEGLRANYVGGAVNLSWNKFERDGAVVEYYQVSRSTISGSGYKPIGQPLDVTYADLDIVLDTTYYYKVKAVWPNGKESEESDEISVTLIPTPVAGGGHTLALKRDGSLWAWGANSYGQLGDGTTDSKSIPIQAGTATDWTAIAAGGVHTLALKSDGSLWAWGSNSSGQLGVSTLGACLVSGDILIPCSTIPIQVGTATDWISVTAGGGRTLALKSDGSLWAWGSNSSGQLGDGTTVDKSSPVQVGTATDWTAIAAGSSHTLALKSDGSLWVWGWNGSGQLGDGTTVNKTSPVQVGTDKDWTAITAGRSHTLALKSDNSLWAWGRNGWGQLGDGTEADKSSPVQVGTATDWVAIAAGDDHTLALKSDGSLWAWGANIYGQLGDGTTDSKSIPIQVGTETNWTAISAGTWYTIALKSDGGLWAWGFNRYGQLGVSTSEICTIKNLPCSTIPIQVGTATNWTAIAVGYFYTLTLKNDGTLWAWGLNGWGQLGNGTTDDKSSRVQVGTDTDWTAVTAGDNHTLALKSDGSLWAWGSNGSGQLGVSMSENCSNFPCSTVPVQVGTDTDWTANSAGSGHSLGLKSDGSLWAWGGNFFGQLGDGTSKYVSPIQVW